MQIFIFLIYRMGFHKELVYLVGSHELYFMLLLAWSNSDNLYKNGVKLEANKGNIKFAHEKKTFTIKLLSSA